jgi:hypothetical protein
VLTVVKYYNYSATKDVFNHIHRVYGESTSGVQVGGWRIEVKGYEEEDVRVERVCHQVSEEIGRVMWREHINYEHIHELHMPGDSH